MSSDYYVRLEQGRESSPSSQVIEAVARALLLDDEAADHLRRLVRAPRSRFERHPAREPVSPRLLQLMEGFTTSPAFALGPALDILAGNAMADALHEDFSPADNLARMVFLDPAGRDFYQEWDRAAHSCVAELRAAYGRHPESERISEVVADLSAGSAEFADLWARHDVRSKTQREKYLRHRHVGALRVHFSALTVNGAPHQQLVVYQAEPTSPIAAAFERLAERVRTTRREPAAAR